MNAITESVLCAMGGPVTHRRELQNESPAAMGNWQPWETCPIGVPVEMCRIGSRGISSTQVGYMLSSPSMHRHCRTLTHSHPTHWRVPQ